MGVLLSLVLCGCLRTGTETTTGAERPSDVSQSTAYKGWALYSWRSDETWMFSIVPDTNCLHSFYGDIDGLQSNDVNIVGSPSSSHGGLQELKTRLGAFLPGETVLWYEPDDWEHEDESGRQYEHPPKPIIQDVKEFIESQECTLVVLD